MHGEGSQRSNHPGSEKKEKEAPEPRVSVTADIVRPSLPLRTIRSRLLCSITSGCMCVYVRVLRSALIVKTPYFTRRLWQLSSRSSRNNCRHSFSHFTGLHFTFSVFTYNATFRRASTYIDAILPARVSHPKLLGALPDESAPTRPRGTQTIIAAINILMYLTTSSFIHVLASKFLFLQFKIRFQNLLRR